jgi:hypothetical protein
MFNRASDMLSNLISMLFHFYVCLRIKKLKYLNATLLFKFDITCVHCPTRFKHVIILKLNFKMQCLSSHF